MAQWPGLKVAVRIRPGLRLLAHLLAKESLWPHQQEDDQQQEGEGVLVDGGDEGPAEGLQHSQRKATDDGTPYIAETADDAGGKRDVARITKVSPASTHLELAQTVTKKFRP